LFLDRILSFDNFVGELGSLEEASPKTLIDTEIGKAQWKDQRWGRPQKPMRHKAENVS
jgi:hypothetical protein